MLSKFTFGITSAAQPGVIWPLVTSWVQQWTTSPGWTTTAGGRALFHLVWILVRSSWCSAIATPPRAVGPSYQAARRSSSGRSRTAAAAAWRCTSPSWLGRDDRVVSCFVSIELVWLRGSPVAHADETSWSQDGQNRTL